MPVRTFESPYGFSCAQHVLSGPGGNLLIDAGSFGELERRYFESIGGLAAVLLTHGHFDHIQALDALHEAYPEAPIYIHPADLPMLRDAVRNVSTLVGTSLVIAAPAEALEAGIYTLAGQPVEVLHTRGHSPGSCMFFMPEAKALFTGDTIIGESVGRTDLPGSVSKDLLASLQAFGQRSFPADTGVYFGHGDGMPYDRLMACNRYLR